MKNYWLDMRFRRTVRQHVRNHVLVCLNLPMNIFYVNLNEPYIDKCTDYAIQLIAKHGYNGGIREIENIIRYSVSIDRNRFLRH